jgi:hypothetical protein
MVYLRRKSFFQVKVKSSYPKVMSSHDLDCFKNLINFIIQFLGPFLNQIKEEKKLERLRHVKKSSKSDD